LDLIRSLFVWISGILMTCFLFLFVVPFSLLGLQNMVHHVATLWGKGLAFLAGAKIQIENEERIYREGPVLVVSNHQSMFDIPVFYAFLNIQFRWMSKASLFKLPIIGRAMKGAGYISVDREDPKNARASLFTAAEKVKEGASLIIFPEGTRSMDKKKMLPFKKGGFVLAKMSGVPILPVTVVGADDVMPIQKENKIQRLYKARVNVYIHNLITAEEIEKLEPEELSAKVREIIDSKLRSI